MSDTFIPFYDDFMKLWNVKDTRDEHMYPMTGENMANVMCKLLNHYDVRLRDVLDELFKKDRKLEELGYDLEELDKELNI